MSCRSAVYRRCVNAGLFTEALGVEGCRGRGLRRRALTLEDDARVHADAVYVREDTSSDVEKVLLL